MEIIPQIIFYGIILLVTSWFGRPVWFLVQGMLLMGLVTVYLASPSFTFDTWLHSMIGEFDHVNNFLIRSLAIWYISQAYSVLCYRNSTDSRFVCALLQSQVVAYYLETVSHLPYFRMGNLSPTILHFPDKGSIFPAFLALGNLLQLMMSKSYGGESLQTTSFNDRIDGVGMLILGTSVFMYSKQIMSFTMNRTEFYSDSLVPAAAVGSYMIYCGLFSLLSVSFEKAEYKRHIHSMRIVECSLFMALVAIYWTFSDLFNWNVVWVLLVSLMFICNSGLALLDTPSKSKLQDVTGKDN